MALPLPNPLSRRTFAESYGDIAGLGNTLQQQQIANALKQNELNYAPQTSQAEIELKKGQAYENYGRGKNYFEEAKVHPSQIGLNQANTRYKNMETDYIPKRFELDEKNHNRLTSRFNTPIYQMKQAFSMMTPTQKMQFMAENPDAYNAIINAKGNDVLDEINDQGGQQPPQNALMQNGFTPPSSATMPDQVNSLMNQPGMNQQQGLPIQQGQPEQPRFNPQTPQQKEKAQLLLQREINNKQTSAPMRMRAESAAAMDQFLANNQATYAPRIKNALKYAGVMGKGQKAIDQMLAKTPESYIDYQWFKTDFVTTMSNSVKQMEKLTGDQVQREELKNTWLKATEGIDIDPKGAENLINKTVRTMGDISSSIINTAEPVYPGTYAKQYNIPEDFYKKDYLSSDEKSSDTKEIGGKTYKMVDGQWYEQ